MAKLSEKIGYALGDAAAGGITWKVMSIAFPLFFTNIFGLTVADTATLMLVARLFDVVTDPMMGALADMFAATVREQDALLLLPVYDAGGTTDRSVNSDALVREITVRTKSRVELVGDLDAAYEWCAAHRGEFGCFVTCGARDPGLPVLARRLGGQ